MKIFIACFMAVLLWVGSAGAATYYVRADGQVAAANKANATSPSAAATSLSMSTANAATFAAGDTVLYSSQGGAYSVQLNPPSSGDASKITYANVPTETPVLSERIYINKNNIVVSGFDVISTTINNYYGGVDIVSSDGLLLHDINIDMSGGSAGTRYIITVSGAIKNSTFSNITGTGHSGYGAFLYGANGENLTLSNIDLTGKAGFYIKGVENLSLLNCSHVGDVGFSYYIYESITGVLTMDNCSGVSTAVNANFGFDGISLAIGSTIKNCTSVSGAHGYSFKNVQNLTVDNCVSSGAGGYGFSLLNGCSDIVFTGCTAENGRSDGFCILDVTTTSHDITFNSCRARSNGVKTTTSDGDGFTCHLLNYNIYLNYCIAEKNMSAGYAMVGDSTGHLHNCIAYQNAGDWRSVGGVDQVRGGFFLVAGWTVKNCIGYGNYPREICASTTTASLANHNCYKPLDDSKFANLGSSELSWATYNADYEVNSKNADPLFDNATGAVFTLQNTSPAINAGTYLGATTDYAGNRVPCGPTTDIGAYEFQYNYQKDGGMWGSGSTMWGQGWQSGW